MKKENLQHIDIKSIENPEFLKDLSYKELDILSEDIRKYLLEVTSVDGGHLASNLGAVESTISLCKNFDFTKDKIIFDVGHQCYTYKVLTGRKLEGFRKKGGISGFQKISESPYDHYEAGHSSTSISAANGFAIARDLKKEKYDVIAYIGDASIVNGLSFEGINNGSEDHKIIIILNDNDMSISKPVGGLARAFRRFATSGFYRKSKHAFQKMLKGTKFGRSIYNGTASIKNWFKRHLVAMNLFDNLGYSVIGPVDGHNIKAIDKALIRAKSCDKSVVVHLKTIKGKGYEPAENDKVGSWHGVGGFDIEKGTIKTSQCESWSDVYEETMIDSMGKHDNAIVVCAATGVGSGVTAVSKLYPNRTIDVGIAEEHALVMSTGLALEGYHPIVSMYSTFLQRAYDEVSHDLARLKSNATILIDRAGLVGKDGNTHQGIYDEAFLYTIPNVSICMASNVNEAKQLMAESFNNHQVVAIRYPRENICKEYEDNETVTFGKWIIECSGKDTAIVSVGPETKVLKKLLLDNNKNVTLVNAIYQRPMDEECIKSLLLYNRVIIYDAYAIKEGFPSILAARLMELGYKGEVIIKAIPDVFVDHATIDEQKEQFGLKPEQIYQLL